MFRNLFYDVCNELGGLASLQPAGKIYLFRSLARRNHIAGLREDQVLNALVALYHGGHFDTSTQWFVAYLPRSAADSTSTNSLPDFQSLTAVPAPVNATKAVERFVQGSKSSKPNLPFECHDEVCQLTQELIEEVLFFFAKKWWPHVLEKHELVVPRSGE